VGVGVRAAHIHPGHRDAATGGEGAQGGARAQNKTSAGLHHPWEDVPIRTLFPQWDGQKEKDTLQ
jgi:hypothetical protein